MSSKNETTGDEDHPVNLGTKAQLEKIDKIDVTIEAINNNIAALVITIKKAEKDYLKANPDRSEESIRIMAKINSRDQALIRVGRLAEAGHISVCRYVNFFHASGMISINNLEEISKALSTINFNPKDNDDLKVIGKHEMKPTRPADPSKPAHIDLTVSSGPVEEAITNFYNQLQKLKPKPKSRIGLFITFIKAVGSVLKAAFEVLKSTLKDR